VVVGASAGGVEALADLAASLPPDLPAAVFVVLHLPPTGTSALPDILSRHGPLPASHVKDGEPIENRRIYVAPPDHHVLLRSGHVHLARGPRKNGHRPAVDTLFRSAAREYGRRVIGVVLSGALEDGTAGLVAIKGRGGLTVVQEPGDAIYPGMPGSALAHARVDHVLPATLARGDGGRAWFPESLLTRQSEGLEAALWIALRSLEERAALARKLAAPARRPGPAGAAAGHGRRGRRPVGHGRGHQPARPAGALPGHLQPADRRRQGRARSDRGGGAAARRAAADGVTGAAAGPARSG
jgi:CheB methylesterase